MKKFLTHGLPLVAAGLILIVAAGTGGYLIGKAQSQPMPQRGQGFRARYQRGEGDGPGFGAGNRAGSADGSAGSHSGNTDDNKDDTSTGTSNSAA